MIAISPAARIDLAELTAIHERQEAFYGTVDFSPFEQRLAEIDAAVFDGTGIGVLLARIDGELVGFASYSLHWPAAGTTTSLFLKELYVDQAHRRAGVGRALMAAVFVAARAVGCSRVEWQTESTNEAARAFYARLGAEEHPIKVAFRAPADLL